MDIAPGTTVCVEITAPPTAASARKTLTRVACKDPAVARQIRARKQQRPSLETWQRGGRMWRHRMKSRPPVSLNAGAKYTLRATLDVIRDLESVGSWVKVSPV